MANHLIAVFVVSGKIRGLGRYVRFCPLSFADNNVIITLNKYIRVCKSFKYIPSPVG